MDDCCCGAPTSTIIERSTVFVSCYTPYLGAPVPTTIDQVNSILVAMRAALIAKPHFFAVPAIPFNVQNVAVMWPSLAVVDPDPGMPFGATSGSGTVTVQVSGDLLYFRMNKVMVRFPTPTRVCLREVPSLCENYPRAEACVVLGPVTQAEIIAPELAITSLPPRCNGALPGTVFQWNDLSYVGPFVPVRGCCLGNV